MVFPIQRGRKQDDPPLTGEELRIERTQRFGTLVRVLRERSGMSKGDFAKKAHLPVAYVEEMEAMTLVMEDLSAGVLVRIGEALGEAPKSLAIRAQFMVEDLPMTSQRIDVEEMRQAEEASETIQIQGAEPPAT